MDESTNPQSVDEGQPSGEDSQAAEPRGRLGGPGDENTSGGYEGSARDDGAADSRAAAGDAGTSEEHDSGDAAASQNHENGGVVTSEGHGAVESHGAGEHLADERGGPAVRGRRDEGDPNDLRTPGEEGIGGDSHGSNRSFLLGLAWWP
ncbi:hypothetical protein ACGFIV_30520 [Sphaerisporangium sp. NPDC049003]|uniref:hypothetical protein n=1 Tax=Sphaerisporangium sp. NPDC049003 TaxID=3364517 RepID=UPI00371144DC